jgi:transposase
VVVISRNAKYHHVQLHAIWREERIPAFELDFLPAYSPELNPIERVWKLTRRLCLHNRYCGFIESVVEAVEYQFRQWSHENELPRSLCAII